MFYERVPEKNGKRPRTYYKLRMRGKLRNCQTKGVKFMRDVEDKYLPHYGMTGGLLCLTMGLGKSVTATAHSLTAPAEFPTLVVCSKTLIGEWRMQCMHRFFKGLTNVLYFHKDYIGKRVDTMTRAEVMTYDIVVTSYDTIIMAGKKFPDMVEEVVVRGDEHSLYKDKIIDVNVKTRSQSDDKNATGSAILFKTPWERVIIDESQRISNSSTKTWRNMMAVYGKFKWCLTGTPIKNNVSDIWSQLRWCGFSGMTKKFWKKRANTNMRIFNIQDRILSMNYEDAGIVMPSHHKEYFSTEFGSEEERRVYTAIKNALEEAHKKFMLKEVNFICILSILLSLRQACIAPYVITKESKRNHTPGMFNIDDVVEDKRWVGDIDGTAGVESTRMRQIVDIVSTIPPTEKILIFTSFTSVSDLLTYALSKKLPSREVIQIDGGLVGDERDMALHNFRKPSSTIQICILTYKVGGEGLNLTCANHCIMVEPWWNYAVRDQAEARAWRCGQTKPVYSYYPQINNTLELYIEALCVAKRHMGKMLMNAEEGNLPNIGLSSGDIEEFVRRGRRDGWQSVQA